MLHIAHIKIIGILLFFILFIAGATVYIVKTDKDGEKKKTD